MGVDFRRLAQAASRTEARTDVTGHEIAASGRDLPTRLFLLLAPLLYLAFALVTPPFQTPDEPQHLFRAYQLASFRLIGKRREAVSGDELPPSLSRAAAREIGATNTQGFRPLTKARAADRWGGGTALDAGQAPHFTNFSGSVVYSPIGYGPQIAAIWSGRAFGMSVEGIVRLGRVYNAALTILLLLAAFRALPFGRLLLLIIALLPMTAACAGSFGQDGLIIGASAWLTALGLRAVVWGKWVRADAFVAVALTSAVTLSKMVYLPLGGLALIPRPARAPFRLWAWPPLTSGLIALLLLGWWLHLIAGVIVPPARPGVLTPGAQIAHMLHHPLSFPKALGRTYIFGGKDLFRTLFTFGWLNVGPVRIALWTAVVSLAAALWQGDHHAERVPHAWRFWSFVVCAAVVILLSLALYISWNPPGAPRIEGLQGRYFLPIVLPALLPLLRQKQEAAAALMPLAIVLIIVADIASLAAIADAFYV